MHAHMRAHASDIAQVLYSLVGEATSSSIGRSPHCDTRPDVDLNQKLTTFQLRIIA